MALKEKLIDKAQKLIQKGYLDKAVVEYRAAADADPKDISIRLRIGDLYVKLGKKPEAVKEYTEAARANAQRGFYLKAIAVYKQVLKLEENLDTHNKLAELYLKQRLIADAVGEYSYIVHWYESRGKSKEVLDLLKKMVDIDPENVGVRLKLADLYQKLSFEKDSLSEYSIIFEKLLTAGKLDKAEKVYLSLYNANPSEERVLSGLAELYRIKGDDAQRLKFLKGLFNYYIDASLTEEARRAAQDIIRINPDDPHASRFLKKDEKSAAQSVNATRESEAFSIASSIEVPVDGVEQKASEEPIVSWPEEEIEITIEGFEESAPSTETLHEAAETTPDSGMVTPQPVPPYSVQEANAGSADEIEIDIDALLKGELPQMEAVEQSSGPAVSEPPQEVVDAQAGAPEPVVEQPAVEASPVAEAIAPATSEQFQVEEAVEEAGIEEAISVISEELQEELTISVSAGPQAPVREEENIEVLENIEPAEEAVETESAIGADEFAIPGAAEEPIVEIELEPLMAEQAREPALEAVEPPVEAAEPMEAVEAAEEGRAIEAAEIKAEPLPDEPEVSVSADEAAASEIIEQPETTDIIEEAVHETADQIDELDEDLSSAIQELMEKMEEPQEAGTPQEEEAAVPQAAAPKEDYIDLSAELGMEEALKDLVCPWGGKESAEDFDEFKDGIGNQLNKEDSETHYNLGIAYMEMELYSEASKEFKIALKDARLELDCYTRLGLCAMAENNPEEAAAYYSRGLKAAGRSDEEKKALMYELALAYEASGKDDEASELFREIFAMDPDFRDIALKFLNTSVMKRPMAPLDDGFIEVELL